MSIWKLLGFGGDSEPTAESSTQSVRLIAEKLDSLPPEEARYVAALAYVLGRVAYADREISVDEIAAMEAVVEQYGDLSEERAALVVEVAAKRAKLYGGTENFLVTRELSEITTQAEREQILQALFAVAAGDDSISNVEDRQIRQIASELGLSHRDFVEARAAWSDKREVVKTGRGDPD